MPALHKEHLLRLSNDSVPKSPAERHQGLKTQPALAYNLANFVRRLGLPTSVKQWSLTTLRDKLSKIGAKVVSHARYVIFQLAEVAVPRELS